MSKQAGRRLLAAALALLLLARTGRGGWADVALAVPGEPELLPPDAYRPVKWTDDQIASLRRRALLQQSAEWLLDSSGTSGSGTSGTSGSGSGTSGTSGSGSGSGSSTGRLPVCELDLRYRVVDLSPSSFTSVVTLTNNRELDLAHWQVVWRYQQYTGVQMQSANGAIALSLGLPSGAPVRLVDTFTSDGIPGGGGAYSFVSEAGFLGPLPPPANRSLGIEAVNINGMQCSLAGGGGMQYSQCLDPSGTTAALLAAAQAPAAADGSELQDAASSGGPAIVLVGPDGIATTVSSGGSGLGAGLYLGGGGGSSGACWVQYCCGVVLLDPLTPSPPPPPPPPSPAPPPPTEEPPLPPVEIVPSPGVAVPPQPPSPDPPSGKKGGTVAVAAAAGGGGAAAAVLAGAAFVLARRRRRQRRAQQQAVTAAAGSRAVLPMEAGSSDASSSSGSSQLGQTVVLQGSPTLSSILMPVSGGMLRHHGSSAPPPAQGAELLPCGTGSKAGCQVSTSPISLAAAGKASPATCEGSPGSGSGPASSPSSSSGGSGGSGGSSSQGGLAQEVVLHEQLGSGAFGVVYRGDWQGRPVAVKVLQTTCGSASRELESFRQEARVLAGLRHSNIVCLLAACTVPPNICIIEELAEGGSLHQLLHGWPGARRRRPLPYRHLLQVAADIAAAMCYLHPRIVHRDLKSQNVLLDGEGRAKVCDFGIAKFKDSTFVSTAAGQAGTPAYMAPECFDGKPVSEKVDVFSFAVLVWEMQTGRVPWQEVAGHMQIIYQVGVMHQRLPLPDDCPAFLRQLVEQCWSEDPAARPAFTAILRRLQEELAGAATDDSHHAECRRSESVTETDVSSVAAGSSAHSNSSDSRGISSGASGSIERVAEPQLQMSASPFAAYAAPFSSSSGSSSSGGYGEASVQECEYS